MELTTIIDRKNEIRTLPEPAPVVRERMQTIAASLSLAGTMAAHCEVVNEALAALVTVLYQRDDDKCPANIDRVTGRILIPVPWGSAGWKRWGLRKWEAEIVRRLLMGRLRNRQIVPLFDYSSEMRYWSVNLATYNSQRMAMAYLQAHAVTLAEWRGYVDAYREAARNLK